MGIEKPLNTFNGVKLVIDDYTPYLNDNDVNNLVDFIVELFCATNANEVEND